MIHPDSTELMTQLAEVAARNAASTVASKVRGFRARKQDQGVVNDLIELVNDLVEDKNELISIAQALEQELVAQQISDEDTTYITTEFLPVVEQLAGLTEGDNSNTAQALEAVKSLITVETLTIMQLVGFNFRRAIGEPLTTVVERLILNRVAAPGQSVELQSLQIRQQTAWLEAIQDPEARRLLQSTAADSAAAAP